MQTKALGLVEVIGFITAVEAADAALKAANVELLGIEKVDGGIVTVELIGEVDAVKASVEAGKEAAKRVGTLRTAHVIARTEESIMAMLLGKRTSHKEIFKKAFEEKREEKQEEQQEEKLEEKQEEKQEQLENKLTSEAEIEIKNDGIIPLEENQLKEMSNSQLRNLIDSLGISLVSKNLKTAKKEDLIQIIKDFYKEGEN